jgi:F-type H+-transporting ATPase subunit b
LAETRKEISRLRDEANEEKAQIIKEARETARAEAESVAEQERARLATERQQVLLSLRNEIGELAFTLADKIVRDSLRDEDRQRKLVDDFIAGVGAGAKVEAGS